MLTDVKNCVVLFKKKIIQLSQMVSEILVPYLSLRGIGRTSPLNTILKHTTTSHSIP